MEKKYVCKFCNKMFPSGKSLGGHIRIHTNEFSVVKTPKKTNNKRSLVDQQQLLCCRECGKGFVSSKALCGHMASHSQRYKIVMVIDTQSDTEASRKRSKKQSFSSSPSSSASEIDQEHRNTALSLMKMSIDSKGHNLVVNSLVAESSENNSEILETKASSEEQLKFIFSVKKNHDLKTDKVAVDDHLRTLADDDDSYSSDSDYFMNGPKKSNSDISVDRSLRNGDELGVKEGGSKYELHKSKSVLPCYENDSCADTDRKIHRSSDCKSPLVKKASSGANKNSNGHKCPKCFKVFKSGQALGGHKRSHFFENQEQRIKHKAAAADVLLIDLNLPAQYADE
ncbi:unnamed protein product [Eruca vesicaria subsp. sativa]|uniref:C2H2-type domain-containing protein n=1 Tax=Eruca vesicaria subsp. sativa TaxID=29727 RepID=A0ABC8M3V3_ERUVS|nr:unnamed protein product [Eruca vesicaria subsp. sativa]